MKKKTLALNIKKCGIFVLAALSTTSPFAQPKNSHYLFNYTKIGLRDLGAPSFSPLAAQAVQGLMNKFTFVAPNGSGTEPPYFSEITKVGDVAFLEADWGAAAQWAGLTDTFNQISGNYVTCFNEAGQPLVENCNTTDKKAKFAIVKFNTSGVNEVWNRYIDRSQVINGHPININDVRQHLIAHELGHVIGMRHETDDSCPYPVYGYNYSVMENGSWCLPLYTGYTNNDITWISTRY